MAAPLVEVYRQLTEELQVLRQFVATLQQEQDALVAGNADPLIDLAERKSALADQLTLMGEARDNALLQAGLSMGKPGMDTWLASVPPPAQAAWAEFIQLATQSRDLNALNGKLIFEKISTNHQALRILTSAGERASLYGPDGQTRIGGSSRTLGSA